MKIFIAILFYIYAISNYTDLAVVLGAYRGCPWYCHLTYSFVHTNLVHLASCCAVLALYWIRAIRFMRVAVWLPVVATATVVSSALACSAQPTVGLSAVLFAFTGLISAASHAREIIRVSALTAFSAVFTWLFAHAVNTPIHIYAFAIALAAGILLRRYIYNKV